MKTKSNHTMKLSEIQNLIKFVVKTGASEVSYETKDFKLTIKTSGGRKKTKHELIMQPAMPIQTAAVPVHPSVQQAVHKTETKIPEAKAETPPALDKLITIKSPMIGTFYRSSSPDKPPYVNVGDEIIQGKVLCIIEAMKLFNEIESEISGRIVKVLVDDASPVEYDQPLFLVEPN
jgi:acetyl-CoA carboxylase biotin carboxyl carrier protein